jgi:hypothetical protein
MRATWRPLPAWPYEPRPKRPSRFDSTWEATLDKLEREIAAISGTDVVIGIVCDESQISMSGTLKNGSRASLRHPGVEVSFEVPGGRRMVFHTDTYSHLVWNIRAVALGLEALRAVERHGITSNVGEQYAGFAAIGPGGPDPDRGRVIVERNGSVAKALFATHPDHGGDPGQFADVEAYRKAIGAGAR